MSSPKARDGRGQIALMDAVVFFAIALLICSMQLGAYVRETIREDWFDRPNGRCDPRGLLRVLLRTSIGAEATISVDPEFSVPARTTVSECLAVEVAALTKGFRIEFFSDLNAVMLGVICNLSHPLLKPHLLLNLHAEDGMVPLFRIEHSPPGPGDLAASTCELPNCGGELVTVSLLLEPAFLPEGRNV